MNDIYQDFEEDNEPFTDEMYDEITRIEEADALVDQFFATSEGIARKDNIAKALGETKFERINYPIQKAIKLALRDLAWFVSSIEEPSED